MATGSRFAPKRDIPAMAAGLEPGVAVVHKGLVRWGTLAGLVIVALVATFTLGLAVGRASDRDEAIMTVQVSSADHELLEGYFTLGDNATVMVKPGSELYKFLARQRGRKVKITLIETSGPELSRLER
jgi:hypothetical protein